MFQGVKDHLIAIAATAQIVRNFVDTPEFRRYVAALVALMSVWGDCNHTMAQMTVIPGPLSAPALPCRS